MAIDWTKSLERTVILEQHVVPRLVRIIEKLSAKNAQLARRAGEVPIDVTAELVEVNTMIAQLPSSGIMKV